MADAKKPENKGWLYVLIYLFTWLTGLIFYLIEKDDKKIRFHAMQAILLGVVMFVLSLTLILSIVSILIWIYGLYIGYQEMQGQTIKVPIIGDYAEKYA